MQTYSLIKNFNWMDSGQQHKVQADTGISTAKQQKQDKTPFNMQ